eukprot:TRINITY_DN5204_c0_g2_i2.p1 TRINITY_DN5204_c0_g2~~TRINITY_DN5204_c0_g2_i2.p1  ORF type:complete len:1054 (-),score=219.66 TRINITY_DN5204_c0_g2_i2:285-3446(-)
MPTRARPAAGRRTQQQRTHHHSPHSEQQASPHSDSWQASTSETLVHFHKSFGVMQEIFDHRDFTSFGSELLQCAADGAPYGTAPCPQFLDLGCAPGGFSACLLQDHMFGPNSLAYGVSLPPHLGGFHMAFASDRFFVQLGDLMQICKDDLLCADNSIVLCTADAQYLSMMSKQRPVRVQYRGTRVRSKTLGIWALTVKECQLAFAKLRQGGAFIFRFGWRGVGGANDEHPSGEKVEPSLLAKYLEEEEWYKALTHWLFSVLKSLFKTMRPFKSEYVHQADVSFYMVCRQFDRTKYEQCGWEAKLQRAFHELGNSEDEAALVAGIKQSISEEAKAEIDELLELVGRMRMIGIQSRKVTQPDAFRDRWESKEKTPENKEKDKEKEDEKPKEKENEKTTETENEKDKDVEKPAIEVAASDDTSGSPSKERAAGAEASPTASESDQAAGNGASASTSTTASAPASGRDLPRGSGGSAASGGSWTPSSAPAPAKGDRGVRTKGRGKDGFGYKGPPGPHGGKDGPGFFGGAKGAKGGGFGRDKGRGRNGSYIDGPMNGGGSFPFEMSKGQRPPPPPPFPQQHQQQGFPQRHPPPSQQQSWGADEFGHGWDCHEEDHSMLGFGPDGGPDEWNALDPLDKVPPGGEWRPSLRESRPESLGGKGCPDGGPKGQDGCGGCKGGCGKGPSGCNGCGDFGKGRGPNGIEYGKGCHGCNGCGDFGGAGCGGLTDDFGNGCAGCNGCGDCGKGCSPCNGCGEFGNGCGALGCGGCGGCHGCDGCGGCCGGCGCGGCGGCSPDNFSWAHIGNSPMELGMNGHQAPTWPAFDPVASGGPAGAGTELWPAVSPQGHHGFLQGPAMPACWGAPAVAQLQVLGTEPSFLPLDAPTPASSSSAPVPAAASGAEGGAAAREAGGAADGTRRAESSSTPRSAGARDETPPRRTKERDRDRPRRRKQAEDSDSESSGASDARPRRDKGRSKVKHRSGRSVRERRQGYHGRTYDTGGRGGFPAMFRWRLRLIQGDKLLDATRFGLFCAMAWSLNSIFYATMHLLKDSAGTSAAAPEA